MNDDITTDFLDEPESAVEEYMESVENENIAESTVSESESGQLLESSEVGTEEETSSELVDQNSVVGSTSDGTLDYDSIYDDIPVVSVSSAPHADALAAGESEGFSDDGVYVVSFNGQQYDVFFPADALSDLYISDTVLYNMGTETIYGCVLENNRSDVVDNLLFILDPTCSPAGTSNNYRYGSFSRLRTYTRSGIGSQYTSSDDFGTMYVSEEPPIFSGNAVAPFFTFGLFVVAAILLLKHLFKRKVQR